MLWTRIQTHGKEQNAKIPKFFSFQFQPSSIRRHLEFSKKKSSMKYDRLKYKLKSKNKEQKCSKLTELWIKNQFFGHAENRRHFENLRKELPKI
jgi:hypothetical protein